MLWLYLALIAQFLNAAVILLDRFLVKSKTIQRPAVYAFYVGMLSGVVVILWPLGFVRPPTLEVVWLSVVIAAAYILSILFLYKSLKLGEASDVAPVTGAVSAIATFVFSIVFLNSGLPTNFFIGFVLLVVGTALMSHLRLGGKAASYAIISGVMFGLSSVFVKIIFTKTDFLDGFFWSRMANVAGALMLLVWPANFRAIRDSIFKSSRSTKSLILANKALAGFAFLLILLAIKLGEVSLVSAMSGMQFVFVLLFAVIFTKRIPKFFSETVHLHDVLWHKFVSTMLIVIGFFLLFL